MRRANDYWVEIGCAQFPNKRMLHSCLGHDSKEKDQIYCLSSDLKCPLMLQIKWRSTIMVWINDGMSPSWVPKLHELQGIIFPICTELFCMSQTLIGADICNIKFTFSVCLVFVLLFCSITKNKNTTNFLIGFFSLVI